MGLLSLEVGPGDRLANLPPGADAGYWDENDLVVDPCAAGGNLLLMVDPAMTKGARADYTGLAVVGLEPIGRQRAVVGYAKHVRVGRRGFAAWSRRCLERARRSAG